MTDPIIEAGRQALRIEARAVSRIADDLGAPFRAAVDLVGQAAGHAVLTGIGKSGHVGRKIAATLASTGTPALFVHSTEALHGDSGMVVPGDVVIAISSSGETDEVCLFGELLARRGIPVIAMTGGATSRLAKLADVVLDIGVEREADPLDLAPTASTTATMSLGDALAAALMAMREFTDTQFHSHHPAGSLGGALTERSAGSPDDGESR